MLPTSGTFNFQSISIELILREAFERIGIGAEIIEVQKWQSAKRIIDLLLLEWMNDGVNLWTLKTGFLPLNTGQAQYTLSNNILNVTQSLVRTSTRVLNGTAASSAGGDADNAFDGDSTTACTQTAPNGNISYDYGANTTNMLTFIGIQTNNTDLYNIVIEYSQDAVTWTELMVVPEQTFTAGVNVWMDVILPVTARAYRIRATAGTVLNIQEIYFNNNVYDLPMTGVSRTEYLDYPVKLLQGRPNSFYFNRQITPLLNIYPTPQSIYNCILYSYEEVIEDSGAFYTNTLAIPARFYPALIWGISYNLAVKYSPDKIPILKTEYNEAYMRATQYNAEDISYTINPDYSSFSSGGY